MSFASRLNGEASAPLRPHIREALAHQHADPSASCRPCCPALSQEKDAPDSRRPACRSDEAPACPPEPRREPDAKLLDAPQLLLASQTTARIDRTQPSCCSPTTKNTPCSAQGYTSLPTLWPLCSHRHPVATPTPLTPLPPASLLCLLLSPLPLRPIQICGWIYDPRQRVQHVVVKT